MLGCVPAQNCSVLRRPRAATVYSLLRPILQDRGSYARPRTIKGTVAACLGVLGLLLNATIICLYLQRPESLLLVGAARVLIVSLGIDKGPRRLLVDNDSCVGSLVRCPSFVGQVLALVGLILAVALAHPHLAVANLLCVNVVNILVSASVYAWL